MTPATQNIANEAFVLRSQNPTAWAEFTETAREIVAAVKVGKAKWNELGFESAVAAETAMFATVLYSVHQLGKEDRNGKQ